MGVNDSEGAELGPEPLVRSALIEASGGGPAKGPLKGLASRA